MNENMIFLLILGGRELGWGTVLDLMSNTPFGPQLWTSTWGNKILLEHGL